MVNTPMWCVVTMEDDCFFGGGDMADWAFFQLRLNLPHSKLVKGGDMAGGYSVEVGPVHSKVMKWGPS